jgi:thioredoxin-related protein
MIILMMLVSLFIQETPKQEKDFIPYKEAYALHEKSKRPVVIIVTQVGCGPCLTMKKSLLGFKGDFPNIILTEVTVPEARRLYPKDVFDGTPKTIMHAYDNNEGTVKRFRTISGALSKEGIYKYWEIQ